MSQYYTPSIFETFNARHLPAEKVAATFVPPDSSFQKLATNSNHILVGPRGSGKTTLLKMLTLPALAEWKPFDRVTVLPKVDFIGVFIPTDKAWRSQLGMKKFKKDAQYTSVGSVAFTTHVLRSIISTFRSIQSLDRHAKSKGITSIPNALSADQEVELCGLIAEIWKLDLRIKNLSGISLALRARLADIKFNVAAISRSEDQEGALLDLLPYATLDYRECIKFGIEAFETISKSKEHTWALLFDEFEMAPKFIQEEVLGRLRADEAGNIISKVALAPFNQNFNNSIKQNENSPRNDYEVIDLTYPRKKASEQFTKKLFEMNLVDRDMEIESPLAALGKSDFVFEDEDETPRYDEDGKLYDKYMSLVNIDDSFKSYLKKTGLVLNNWDKLSDSEKAQVRKLRSIVITREYYRSKSAKSNKKPTKATRKIETLYTGAPTILSLCEGNPRIFIGMMSPIFNELQRTRQRSKKAKVPKSVQATQVKYSVNTFRSLLKTIAYDGDTVGNPKGMLRILDEIGHYFHQNCVVSEFRPQPHLTFTIPANIPTHTLEVITRALNMGAIIYVPDKGADPFLSSLKGKRFRLSYLMSAYYRLPITMSSSISLGKILSKYQDKGPDNLGQVDLFDDY